jgi:hypothetical protein
MPFLSAAAVSPARTGTVLRDLLHTLGIIRKTDAAIEEDVSREPHIAHAQEVADEADALLKELEGLERRRRQKVRDAKWT